MYSRQKILRGLKHPGLALRELNRLYHRRLYTREFNSSGDDVFREDWDNLVILDACRYELMEEKAREKNLLEKLESRISRGSSTKEFVKGNFGGRKLEEVVYVTANPHLARMKDSIDAEVHEIINVWSGDSWSDMHETVMPSEVTDAAIEAFREFPDKRIVIHYMQPHYPFIYEGEGEVPLGVKKIWHKVMDGSIELEPGDAWKGYRQTFEKAWSSVEGLLEQIEGRTVVTSDHGNVYGERVSPLPVREWGHPIGIYDEKLVRVPWLVFEGERRSIASGSSGEVGDVDEEEIKEKLGKLGYQ